MTRYEAITNAVLHPPTVWTGKSVWGYSAAGLPLIACGPLLVAATPDELYEADQAKPGRPLKFTLAEARAIKTAYWTGKATIAALAKKHKTTTVTIGRIVHGHTYWYA